MEMDRRACAVGSFRLLALFHAAGAGKRSSEWQTGCTDRVNTYRKHTGANGGSVFTSVYTDNPTEIQKLIDFLNAYPCGRMIRNPLGISPFSYQKTTTYSVSLDYKNGKGVFKRLSYEVYPEGRVNVTGWKKDWNQSSVLCRVGRIGSQKTIQFYNRLSSMFEEKLKDTVWQKAE